MKLVDYRIVSSNRKLFKELVKLAPSAHRDGHAITFSFLLEAEPKEAIQEIVARYNVSKLRYEYEEEPFQKWHPEGCIAASRGRQ